jgi:hypothetical protein
MPPPLHRRVNGRSRPVFDNRDHAGPPTEGRFRRRMAHHPELPPHEREPPRAHPRPVVVSLQAATTAALRFRKANPAGNEI